MDNLTTKQKSLLQKPEIMELLKRFDCIAIPTTQTKTQIAVSQRVDQWAQGFQKSPRAVRSPGHAISYEPEVTKVPQIASNEVEAYLVSLYGPRPWKFPLDFAPF